MRWKREKKKKLNRSWISSCWDDRLCCLSPFTPNFCSLALHGWHCSHMVVSPGFSSLWTLEKRADGMYDQSCLPLACSHSLIYQGSSRLWFIESYWYTYLAFFLWMNQLMRTFECPCRLTDLSSQCRYHRGLHSACSPTRPLAGSPCVFMFIIQWGLCFCLIVECLLLILTFGWCSPIEWRGSIGET